MQEGRVIGEVVPLSFLLRGGEVPVAPLPISIHLAPLFMLEAWEGMLWSREGLALAANAGVTE